MKIITIAPLANHFVARTVNDMHMALTHLVEQDDKYATFMFNESTYKILDNSLIELGGSVSLERVLRAAKRINAHEIILPDVFLDGPATIKAVKQSLEDLVALGLLGKYNLMAVCQGKDAKEFRETFEQLSAMPAIDVIGIPKVCAKLHPAGRPYFEGLWLYGSKEIHLLGLWYGWEELWRYKDPMRIRSVDSCMSAFQAKYNLPWYATRPDGFSIDLVKDKVDQNKLILKIGEAKHECRQRGCT